MTFQFAPYSFSKLSLFRKCAKDFWFRYLEGFPSMKWPQMEFGKAVHSAVESRFLGKQESPLSILDFDDQLLAEEMVQKALDYVAFNDVTLIEQPIAVDSTMAPVAFDDPDAFFRGKVDLLLHSTDGNYELVDLKTGYETPPIDQLLAYSFLIHRNLELMPSTATYLMLREGQKVSWDIEPVAVQHYWESILGLISIIESTTSFRPTPNDTCPYCDYLHLCPAARDLHIPNAKTVKGVLSLLLRAELHSSYASRLKTYAREYVKATGNAIEEGERVFTPQTTVSLRIKSDEALEEALLHNGINPEEYRARGFDKDRLKELPNLETLAGKAVSLYSTTKIEWTKKKEADVNVH
jgi:hypothetical protein